MIHTKNCRNQTWLTLNHGVVVLFILSSTIDNQVQVPHIFILCNRKKTHNVTFVCTSWYFLENNGNMHRTKPWYGSGLRQTTTDWLLLRLRLRLRPTLFIESMTMVHLLLVAIFTLLFCIGASGVGVAATGTPSRREWRNLRGFQVQAAGHGRRRAQGAGFGGPGPQGCGFNQCYMPVSGILLLFYAYYRELSIVLNRCF